MINNYQSNDAFDFVYHVSMVSLIDLLASHPRLQKILEIIYKKMYMYTFLIINFHHQRT
jgi:hypothetical protein